MADPTQSTPEQPLISVVMSFRNAEKSLRRSLQSILWQTYPNWELILLDDGSQDGSADVVRSMPDPRIRLAGDRGHLGLPKRLNQGIAMANGEYIARMDADDVAFPSRFKKQLDYLASHPEVDLLATSMMAFDDSDRPLGLLSCGESHEDICKRVWRGFPMPHPTWMGRAEWFRRHPYDEAASKAQDQILLSSARKGSRYAGLSEALVAYHYGHLSVRKSLVGRYNYVRALAGGRTPDFLIGAVANLILFVRDILALGAGMETSVIRARMSRLDIGVADEWDELLRILHSAPLLQRLSRKD